MSLRGHGQGAWPCGLGAQLHGQRSWLGVMVMVRGHGEKSWLGVRVRCAV